jgi:hypothetical protein
MYNVRSRLGSHNLILIDKKNAEFSDPNKFVNLRLVRSQFAASESIVAVLADPMRFVTNKYIYRVWIHRHETIEEFEKTSRSNANDFAKRICECARPCGVVSGLIRGSSWVEIIRLRGDLRRRRFRAFFGKIGSS